MEVYNRQNDKNERFGAFWLYAGKSKLASTGEQWSFVM